MTVDSKCGAVGPRHPSGYDLTDPICQRQTGHDGSHSVWEDDKRLPTYPYSGEINV